MSDTLIFSHDGGKSTSSPPVGLRTCDPRGTPRQPMAGSQMTMIPPRSREAGSVGFTRQQSADFSLRPGGDGTTGSGSVDSDRYHPYHRQLSDARSHSARRQASSSPSSSSSSSSSSSWDRFNGSVQSSFPEPQTDPVEPACFLSHGYPLYSSSGALQHVSSRQYPHSDQCNSSTFSLQSVSAQSHLESNAESVFPKPIYSYSILIFLALRNSAAGLLPVSEIYGFMTQHFPYFKSAPDGWKNSVRHNLSLNKCFQKVENRQEGGPRKCCLWALNPAKVDKMQEELHKWRRKDPVRVRRSMASPEDMDRLLGERPTKLRPLPSFATPALLSRVASIFGPASSCTPAQHRPPPSRRPQYAHAQPPQPCYLPPPAAAASSPAVLPCSGASRTPGLPVGGRRRL
ncbi:forkhead box protein N1 [Pseudoliparis swirei]|uniref:forkhead box protein N1 n=1 Tax=Pseudoliparis swirei TaxID=2059687 RepID=UPI0024BDDD9A|nr:forkhead box protein N1 [Pseudoliparis swirei]